MSWVRLHDGALGHPKIIGIFDPRRPFDLWMWGLSFSQQHLMNGYIPDEALPKGCRRAVDVLVQRHLWESVANGHQIHDYLDWNDSKQKVRDRQAKAQERKEKWKQERVPECVPERRSERVPNASLTKPNQTKPVLPKEQEVRTPPSARSKRPVFVGQRLTVFEWMLDDCMKTLGNYLEQFDLHEWFFTLDDHAVNDGLVIPKRDGGEWLQAQLVEEAQHRGIPIRMATVQRSRGDSRMSAVPGVDETREHQRRLRDQAS